MANRNMERLSEDIKRELSAAVRELKDKRLDGIVSVTHCEVTSDLSFCRVYVSYYGKSSAQEAIACLTNASGFLKKYISSRIKIRKTPDFVFIQDNSLERYQKINDILKNISENISGSDNSESLI